MPALLYAVTVLRKKVLFLNKNGTLKAPGFLLLFVLVIFFGGCSRFAGSMLLPTLGNTASKDNNVFINGVFQIPCAFVYCFGTYGATAGEVEYYPTNLRSDGRTFNGWIWSVEYSANDASRFNAEPLLSELEVCDTEIYGPMVPPPANNMLCAMQRIQKLISHFISNNNLPKINVSTLLIPYGERSHYVWLNFKRDTIPLRFVQIISPNGYVDLPAMSNTITHELLHVLVRKKILKHFYSDTTEETSAYAVGLCAAAIVGGNKYKYEWQNIIVKNDLLDPANGTSVSASGSNILAKKFADINMGIAKYDGSSLAQYKLLLDLCDDQMKGSHLRINHHQIVIGK